MASAFVGFGDIGLRRTGYRRLAEAFAYLSTAIAKYRHYKAHVLPSCIRACAHRDYLKRTGTPVQVADLVSHDLIAGDRNRDIDMGLVAKGFATQDLHFALRSDDLIAQWASVKAGVGVGFMGDYLLRSEPSVQLLLPDLELPQFPMWLTVHRELQTSVRIRAVYDFLATKVEGSLQVRAKNF
jgi:DNA-binding transcriptional LysR family regulator